MFNWESDPSEKECTLRKFLFLLRFWKCNQRFCCHRAEDPLSHTDTILVLKTNIPMDGYRFFYSVLYTVTQALMSSYRMLWDLRLISFQQRFISPVWCGPPPLNLLHSVPSSCPSLSTVDWHGTQWHPGHEGRPAAKHMGERQQETPTGVLQLSVF